MSAPQKIIELVEDFKENKHEYTNANIFDEENTKVKFLNPFFEELGWNVRNEGLSARFREVVFEDSIKVGKKTKAPDYSFRLGGERIFFVEAKKPSRDIANDKEHAFQVRRYGWSAGLPLCILTDFEELAIYDTTLKPEKNQSASIGRIKYYKYTEYVEKWDEIYDIFSKDAVLSGKFDNYANNVKHDKKGTSKIDDEFLKEIEQWRLLLARNIALRNEELSIEDLNYAVQLTIDRIIFLRITEDRGIERYGRLHDLLEKPDIYKNFTKICKEADQKYNSGLFHFNQYDKEDFTTDTYTLDLIIDDKVFKEIFKNLYYPNSPYEFSLISTEILGKIYEQFLGKIIRLTPGHQAKVEEKPEVKKAGGVYYTPQYIVDYMIDKTVGEKIKDKTPKQISKIRIIDPACGSGSFLIRAYQYLLDYHVDYYSKLERPPKDTIYTGKDGINRLTIREKKRILKNNIYGVDIDTLAVEVTKLSLLLKVLEDQNKDQLEAQQKLFHERALPNLSNNIKNGNSIVNNKIITQEKLSIEEIKKIKPFDWKQEFSNIFNETKEESGFDVVIGNPPYISAKVHAKFNPIERKFIKKSFGFKGSWDIFITFLNQSINITNSKGYYGWIVPNKLLISEYANSTLNKLIKNGLNYIVDVSKFNVFENASVYPIIVIGNDYKKRNSFKKYKIDKIKDLKTDNLIEEKELNNDYTTIKDLNLKMGSGAAGYQAQEIKKCVHNFDEKIEGDIPFAVSGSIDPYKLNISTVRYMKDTYTNPVITKNKNIADSKWNFWCNEKIIIAGMTKRLEAIYVKEPLAIGVGTYAIYDFGELSPYYILGCLNSNYFTYTFKKMFKNKHLQGDYLAINKGNLLQLPMKIPDESSNKLIIESVKEIMEYYEEYNKCNTPTERKLLQNQIDGTNKKINDLIYQLYDLTNEEIKLIEDSI